MSGPVYRLRGVAQTAAGRTVLDLDALDVAQGEIVGLKGHNGAGKTTLLRILALLDAPARGEVLVFGRPADVDDLERRRKVTMLMQESYLLKRSVRANVAYGLRLRGQGKDGRVDEALRLVGLDPADFGPRPWNELSGGEAQRVALAARLVLRPEVLLMDEPTANLDRDSVAGVRRAALAARDQWGATLVVAEHDHAWLEAVCDRVLTLEHGRIID